MKKQLLFRTVLDFNEIDDLIELIESNSQYDDEKEQKKWDKIRKKLIESEQI
tara:strand:+ start:1745 stop:1900 length:156 start_codon:yes stop_codon:yes gene_type:complete